LIAIINKPSQMNVADIQQFLDNKTSTGNEYVKIAFKKRDAVFGLFVRGHNDYNELKSKNFWRIVPRSQFNAYNASNDVKLAKIFHGSEFTRLTILKESFD
jgi:hypothetical protein